MNQGTVVTVENLFYNTPARINIMKSERAEILDYRNFWKISYYKLILEWS